MNVKRWSLLDPCSVFYRPNDDVLKQHSVECAPDNTISVDNISSSGKSTHPVDRLGYESSASRSAANVSEFRQTSGSAKLSSTATINSNHHQPPVRLLFIRGRTHYFRMGVCKGGSRNFPKWGLGVGVMSCRVGVARWRSVLFLSLNFCWFYLFLTVFIIPQRQKLLHLNA